VLVEVEDECGGLPPGRAEDLFRPFEQRGSDRSGLGLGLAIARQLVERHGGTIDAASAGEGRGAAFTVRLPIAGQAAAGVASHDGDVNAAIA
jgi:signal transduction histidine kinase